MRLLKAPFPRPKLTRSYATWVLAIGVGCSLFILLYKPFGIENQTGELYVDLIILSLGLVFALAILSIEWIITKSLPGMFSKWTIGKALIWYTFLILFAGTINFLYKSYLGGFRDFTFLEFFFVLLRTVVISFTVSLVIVGIYQLFNRNQLLLFTSNEVFMITLNDGKKIEISLDKILYIASDDNYVDIHYGTSDARDKLILRSSLKNLEDQLVYPISPIRKCHRQYLINVRKFEVIKSSSRSMTLSLIDGQDIVPVSSRYVEAIKKELSISH